MLKDLCRYNEKQIYLLKDGSFVLITGVDPITKFKKDEKSRICYCRVGHSHNKGDEFKDCVMVVEDEPTGTVISFDFNKIANLTVKELRDKEAYYLGTLSETKLKDYERTFSDWQDLQKF